MWTSKWVLSKSTPFDNSRVQWLRIRQSRLKRKESLQMSKMDFFSEKLGKTVTIQETRGMGGRNISDKKSPSIVMMGWMKTGWSKSSSWNMP